jgi:hypothetical protein
MKTISTKTIERAKEYFDDGAWINHILMSICILGGIADIFVLVMVITRHIIK